MTWNTLATHRLGIIGLEYDQNTTLKLDGWIHKTTDTQGGNEQLNSSIGLINMHGRSTDSK